MTFLVVADWGENNRVTAENRAPDEATADAMVSSMVTEGYANAFHVPLPTGSSDYWVVDAEAQTVTTDQDQADADALASSWTALRSERDALLVSSDWTQYNDSPLTDEVKTSWQTYRQALRDLPENTDDPADPTWPPPPG